MALANGIVAPIIDEQVVGERRLALVGDYAGLEAGIGGFDVGIAGSRLESRRDSKSGQGPDRRRSNQRFERGASADDDFFHVVNTPLSFRLIDDYCDDCQILCPMGLARMRTFSHPLSPHNTVKMSANRDFQQFRKLRY